MHNDGKELAKYLRDRAADAIRRALEGITFE